MWRPADAYRCEESVPVVTTQLVLCIELNSVWRINHRDYLRSSILVGFFVCLGDFLEILPPIRINPAQHI